MLRPGIFGISRKSCESIALDTFAQNRAQLVDTCERYVCIWNRFDVSAP
jgi:hypothetical protein